MSTLLVAILIERLQVVHVISLDHVLYLGVTKAKLSCFLNSESQIYIAPGYCYAQIQRMKLTLQGFGLKFERIQIKHIDNTSAVSLSRNPLKHCRAKHIELRHHFIRKHIEGKCHY